MTPSIISTLNILLALPPCRPRAPRPWPGPPRRAKGLGHLPVHWTGPGRFGRAAAGYRAIHGVACRGLVGAGPLLPALGGAVVRSGLRGTAVARDSRAAAAEPWVSTPRV